MLKHKVFLLFCVLFSLSSTAYAEQITGSLMSRQRFIEKQLKEGVYTSEEALLYNYLAIKKPEKLPGELAFLPNEKRLSATEIFLQVFQGLKQKRFSPQLEAFFLEDVDERPNSAGYVDSDKYPLRVHWTNEAYKNLAVSALDFAEYAWETETNMGFNAPLTDDGAGGNNSIDIYIGTDAAGAAGYTRPVAWNLDTDISDCYTYIVIAADSSNALKTTVAHELNHAMQAAHDCLEPSSIWENTATYVMDKVYPDIGDYIYYFPYYQSYPHYPYDYFEEGSLYQYGGMLEVAFLEEYYGNNDGKLIAAVWRGLEQTIHDYADNHPNYIESITSAIAKKKPGSTFEDFLTGFTEWRYFIGENDDGKHFSRAGKWLYCNYSRGSCEVEIDNYVTLSQANPNISGSNLEAMGRMSSSYVEIDLPKNIAADMFVKLEAGESRWGAKLFCNNNSKTKPAIVPLTMDEALQSGEAIVHLGEYDQCVLAVTNLGPANYSPSGANAGLKYKYAYQIGLLSNDLPDPEPFSLSANLFECSGGQTLTISGINFFLGMQVTINGAAATIKNSSSVEVTVITPNISTSGFYEVALSTADGDKVVFKDKVLYNGDTCSCECNISNTCDENCSCDPECLLCTCDVDTACSANCLCDPECITVDKEPSQGCNCSATSQEHNLIEFIVFLALSMLVCAYFKLRSRHID